MKKLSVLFAAVMMFMSVGFAKAQKVASLDLQAVLNLMPEKIKADEQLMALNNTKKAEIEKEIAKVQDLFKKYSEEAPKQTPQVNEQRDAEIQKMQEKVRQMQAAAQKDLGEKTDAAYGPIEKKFNDALTRAAKANGWEFIFDANSMGLIYKAGPDATAAVKKELGL
ncbi:OmpH family outer membrane protein [Planobacterium oryzisoli]|uniref:OmpH family outer membrane protein n=1 Tax=Planobacterium oryzisoli TaxID=2771435 RepID=A0A930YWZ4_9FLAO|nr:OmpH family outer membrane protein [Planobacterium oryzisoli]MBF5027895.1 OmpH family outer membrane protein [Planobacterium oryzisoli]